VVQLRSGPFQASSKSTVLHTRSICATPSKELHDRESTFEGFVSFIAIRNFDFGVGTRLTPSLSIGCETTSSRADVAALFSALKSTAYSEDIQRT
jgi:hypothetical protein